LSRTPLEDCVGILETSSALFGRAATSFLAVWIARQIFFGVSGMSI
jgi:hypothetical protein